MSLRHAILAMLDVEPGTGYDLLTRFRRSVGYFWQTTHQQLYKELHGLHEEGAVSCECIPQQGKPDRKVYRLTSVGEARLMEWLAMPAPAMKLRDPLLVKLFAGRRLAPEAMVAELERHRTAHAETLETYRGLEAIIAAMPARRRDRYAYPLHTLRFGIRFETMWLEWCDSLCRELLASEAGT